MDTRIAIIGIIIQDLDAAEKINQILHEYNDSIVGRMGIPYRERGLSVMSVVVDATMDTIGAISGKLGMIKGVSAKTISSRE